MYNSLARVSAAVLTAAVLCGCAANTAAGIRLETAEYETDTAIVYAERPVFSLMKNRALADELNAAYEKEADDALAAFEELARDGAEIRGGNKYVFELRRDIKYNKNDFVSIVSEIYQYTGGAHGSSMRSAGNINTLTGEDVLLGDLFSDNNYKTLLDRLIENEVRDNPDEYSDLWEKPQIKESNQKDFYVTDEGIVIFYQPYDLSYYARGFVEFTIDYEDISGYLKPEYQKLAPPPRGEPADQFRAKSPPSGFVTSF